MKKIRTRNPVGDLKRKLATVKAPKAMSRLPPMSPTGFNLPPPVTIDGKSQGNIEAGRSQSRPRMKEKK